MILHLRLSSSIPEGVQKGNGSLFGIPIWAGYLKKARINPEDIVKHGAYCISCSVVYPSCAEEERSLSESQSWLLHSLHPIQSRLATCNWAIAPAGCTLRFSLDGEGLGQVAEKTKCQGWMRWWSQRKLNSHEPLMFLQSWLRRPRSFILHQSMCGLPWQYPFWIFGFEGYNLFAPRSKRLQDATSTSSLRLKRNVGWKHGSFILNVHPWWNVYLTYLLYLLWRQRCLQLIDAQVIVAVGQR